MKSLKVGKAIIDIISNVESLKGKIYPLVVDQNTPYPFITYRRSGVHYATNKDVSLFSEECYLELIVADSTYSKSIDLIELICNELKNKKGEFNGIIIKEIKIEDAYEDYVEGSFVQCLKLNIKLR